MHTYFFYETCYVRQPVNVTTLTKIIINTFLAKRCIRFIKMAYTSNNNTVRTISKMGQHSSYSIMGANYKFLRNMYDMTESNVHGKWRWVCDSSAELLSIYVYR